MKVFIVLSLALVACLAEAIFDCNKQPYDLLDCMDIDPFFSDSVIDKCKPTKKPCAKMVCLFTESGVIVDGKVEKQKISEFLDSYAAQHPVWAGAVNYAKQTCLTDKLLAEEECAVRDLFECSLAGFLKFIPESQWKKDESCAESRLAAKSCPVCPQECFVATPPADSCKNCLGLPESAPN